MVCCALVFFLGACNDSAEQQKKEAKENIQEAKEDLKDANKDMGDALRAEREELSAKMTKAGNDLDAEIEELDRKIEKASAKEKVKWQERRARLAALCQRGSYGNVRGSRLWRCRRVTG